MIFFCTRSLFKARSRFTILHHPQKRWRRHDSTSGRIQFVESCLLPICVRGRDLQLPLPRRLRDTRWTVLLVNHRCSFMAPLDGSIVNIAVPSIASSMVLGLETLVWMNLSYLLVLTVLLIKLGDSRTLEVEEASTLLDSYYSRHASALVGVANRWNNLSSSSRFKESVRFVAANAPEIVTESFDIPRSWQSPRDQCDGMTMPGVMTGPVVGEF